MRNALRKGGYTCNGLERLRFLQKRKHLSFSSSKCTLLYLSAKRGASLFAPRSFAVGRFCFACKFIKGCAIHRQLSATKIGCPSYNLSVSHTLDSSPCRGASGEEMRLSALPRPPLDRGGGCAKGADGEVVFRRPFCVKILPPSCAGSKNCVQYPCNHSYGKGNTQWS